jgi:hypothetical protein
VLGVIPLSHYLIEQILAEWEPVSKRMDNTLKRLWVAPSFNQRLVVSHEIVVQLKSAWLLFLDDDVSYFKEHTIHFGVLVKER